MEAKKRREEEEAERERVSYAQIDWHNFVVSILVLNIFCFFIESIFASLLKDSNEKN